MINHTLTALPIVKLGHQALRKIASTVEDISSTEVQTVIENMLVTVSEAGGVGIAAPQMAIDKRIFIVCSKKNERYPDAPDMPATVMINPEITSHGSDVKKGWEGCLSVPAIRGLVPRYNEINITYQDRENNKHTAIYTGFLARIFQHELDHLNGLTFVDRVESTRDLYSESEWYRQFVG
jgi:peptide deformylase